VVRNLLLLLLLEGRVQHCIFFSSKHAPLLLLLFGLLHSCC
jgi:hypothetical protein